MTSKSTYMIETKERIEVKENPEIVVCQVCKQEKKWDECSPADIVRLSMAKLISKDKKIKWNSDGFICKNDLNNYRAKYVEDLFKKEKTEVSALEKHVIEHLKDQEIITTELYNQDKCKISSWDKAADKIASFGGSWKFIISFLAMMLIWIGLNIFLAFYQKAFDPYPFIFLNLILSCVASIQAPVIMMSQNRVEERDRIRAESEYQINLKSEIGIRNINEKMDHLLYKQWEKMSEIQQIQLEILKELSKN